MRGLARCLLRHVCPTDAAGHGNFTPHQLLFCERASTIDTSTVCPSLKGTQPCVRLWGRGHAHVSPPFWQLTLASFIAKLFWCGVDAPVVIATRKPLLACMHWLSPCPDGATDNSERSLDVCRSHSTLSPRLSHGAPAATAVGESMVKYLLPSGYDILTIDE